MIADFQTEDKIDRSRFFQKIFLLANIKFEIILEMLFLKLNNTNMSFDKGIFIQIIYITNESLLSTKRAPIINKKDFIIAVLNTNSKTFIVRIAIRKQKEMLMHSKKQAQIKAQNRAQVGALLFDKAFIKIPADYSNYNNIFSIKNIIELLKNIRINEHTIKLKEGKQSSFRSLYSLRSIKLETLKTYIKTNLTNNFIRLFKFFTRALILFDKKPNRSFRFCINYWNLNNLIIKNRYLLFLIDESLD